MAMSRKRKPQANMRLAPRRLIDPTLAWFVVATFGVATSFDEADADRRAEHALREAGLDVWMPVYGTTSVRRGRKCDVELHFFPGYLFVGTRYTTDERAADLRTIVRSRHVAAVLGIDGPLTLPAPLVQAIADACTGDVRSERLQAAALYRVGEMMRVCSGPFASFYATVTELLTSGHVRADVTVFGRATPVQFEPDMLEKA